MNGSLGYSKEALRRLETGTYRGRKQQYRTSEDQVKAVPKPVPALEGMTRSPSFDQTGHVDTANARARYEQRTNYKPIGRGLDQKDADTLYKLFDRNRLSSGGNSAIVHQLKNNIWNNASDWESKYGKSIEQIVDDYSKDFDKIAERKNIERGQNNKVSTTFGNIIRGATVEPALDFESTLLGQFAPDSNLTKAVRNATEKYSKQKAQQKSGVTAKMSDTGKGAYEVATNLAEKGLSYLNPSAAKYLLTYGKTAENKRQQLKERGIEGKLAEVQSGITGLADAALDYAGFETFPMLKGLRESGNIGKMLAGGAAVGAGEQGLTSLIDLATDRIFNRDQSINAENVRNYMAQGLSEDEAKQQAFWDDVEQVAIDTGSGAAFGALMQLPRAAKVGLDNFARKYYADHYIIDPDDPILNDAVDTSDLNEYAQDLLSQNSVPMLTDGRVNTAIEGQRYPGLPERQLPAIQLPGTNGTIELPGSVATDAPLTRQVTKSVAENAGFSNPRLVIPLEGKELAQAKTQKAELNKKIKALNNTIKLQEDVAKNGKNKAIRSAENKKLDSMKAELADMKQQRKAIDRQISGTPTPIIEQLTPDEVSKVNAFKAEVRKVGNMWAGENGKEQAKRVITALDNYIETGKQEDLREYAMELFQLQNTATEPYTSKAGNTTRYSDFNEQDDLFNAGMSGLDPIFSKSRELNGIGRNPEVDATSAPVKTPDPQLNMNIETTDALNSISNLRNVVPQLNEVNIPNQQPELSLEDQMKQLEISRIRSLFDVNTDGLRQIVNGEPMYSPDIRVGEQGLEQMLREGMTERFNLIRELENATDDSVVKSEVLQTLLDSNSELQNLVAEGNHISPRFALTVLGNERSYLENKINELQENDISDSIINYVNSQRPTREGSLDTVPYDLERFSKEAKPNFVPGAYMQELKNGAMTYDEIINRTTPEFQSVYSRLANDEYVDRGELYNLEEVAYMTENMNEGSSLDDYGVRPELWNRIAGDYFNKFGGSVVDSAGNTQYNGGIEQGHKIVFVTGYSGSGKSSKVVNPLSEKLHALIADVDEVKKLHPENNNGLNDSYIHDESREILKLITDYAVDKGYNIVVPIIGGEKTDVLMDRMKTILGNKLKDYEVGIVCNDYLSPSKASSRILGRIVTEGRYTPPDLPFRVHVDPLVNYTRILERGKNNGINISGFASLDNNVSQGQDAIVRQQGGFLSGIFGQKANDNGEGGTLSGGLSGSDGQGTGFSDVNSDNTGYWLRILGDEDFLLQQAQQQNTDPSVLQEWAYKNLGLEPKTSGPIPPNNGQNPTEDGGKTSQTYTNTGKNAEGWTEEEYNKYTDPSQFQYESVDEEESVRRATDMRQREGREGFKERMMNANKASGAEIDGLMMEWRELGEEARALEAAGQDASDIWHESVRVFRKIQQLSTESAQGLQALAKWSRNTPEGMLADAENIINGKKKVEKNKLQEQLDKIAKKNKKVEFSESFVIQFLKEAELLQGLDPDSRQAREIMAKLGRMVNSQMPATFGEKLTSFLMDNMLGNFRTLITRNAGGNVGLNLAEQILQKPLAAGIDSLLSIKTGQRTQAGLTKEGLAEYIQGFSKGLKDEALDYKTGLHTSRTGQNTLGNAISSNRHVFKNKIMDRLDNLVKQGLSVGDRPFYEAVYNQTLGDYNRLRASGAMGKDIQNLSSQDFKMYSRAAAELNALAAVYQQDTTLSKALLGFKGAVGDLSRGVLGVDILSQFSMPFVKTPANVIERAIDYSPLGGVRNAFRTHKERKNNAFDQNRFANETARNILGTALMGGGALMAANGLMSGSYSDDKDEKQAQRESGMQEYALNIGDKQMDIGWIPVVGSNNVAAAAAYDAFKNGEGNALENAATGLKAGGQALFDQSMFQGLQRLFGTGEAYNTDEGIVGNMANVVKSGLGQGIPSLFRQAGQVIDPYQRDVAYSNEGKSLGFLDNYDLNTLANNVPFLRENVLAPKVGTTGELLEENQGRNIGSKILEDMILPGKVTKVEYSKLNDEAKRLKDATTSSDAYMPKAVRKNVDTEDHTLTNKEWTEYQQKYYKEMTDVGNKIVTSDFYKDLDATEQVKALKSAYEAIKYANQSVYNGKDTNGAAKKYVEAGGGTKGVDAVVTYIRQGIEAEELGVNASTYRKKEAEKPGSGKQYAQEKNAKSKGLSTSYKVVGKGANQTVSEDVKTSAKDLGLQTKTYNKIADKAGSNAEKVYKAVPELQRNGLGTSSAYYTYADALSVDPNLSTADFAKTFNAIDTDNSKGIKQDELIDYFNKNKTSQQQADKMWKMYGDSTWKKVPKLEGGTFKKIGK